MNQWVRVCMGCTTYDRTGDGIGLWYRRIVIHKHLKRIRRASEASSNEALGRYQNCLENALEQIFRRISGIADHVVCALSPAPAFANLKLESGY